MSYADFVYRECSSYVAQLANYDINPDTVRRAALVLESIDTSMVPSNTRATIDVDKVKAALWQLRLFYLFRLGLNERDNLPIEFFENYDHRDFVAAFNYVYRDEMITQIEAATIVFAPELSGLRLSIVTKIRKERGGTARSKDIEVTEADIEKDSQWMEAVRKYGAQLNTLRSQRPPLFTYCPGGKYLREQVEAYAKIRKAK